MSKRRRARQLAVPGADFLARRAIIDLDDRLATITRTFDSVRLIGNRHPDLSETVRRHGHGSAGLDWLDATESGVERQLGETSADLVISFLDLQDVSDPIALLAACRRSLRPDGLFLAAFLGGDTLGALREALLFAETEQAGGASPRVHPMIALRDAGSLLQTSGFALPVIDRDLATVRYEHLFALMADLRAMGGTNSLQARSRKPASRGLFQRAAEIYTERNADADGRIRAIFEIIWMSGWAPHESQQKPMRPGSAKASLAEALATDEGGEKGR